MLSTPHTLVQREHHTITQYATRDTHLDTYRHPLHRPHFDCCESLPAVAYLQQADDLPILRPASRFVRVSLSLCVEVVEDGGLVHVAELGEVVHALENGRVAQPYVGVWMNLLDLLLLLFALALNKL